MVLKGKKRKRNYGREDEILRKSKVPLLLNSYEDIFSDFDPRPYYERALSHDFVPELKAAVRDKEAGMIHVSLLVPKKLRNLKDEVTIKKRLYEHFERHHQMLHKEVRSVVRKGFVFGFVGLILWFMATITKLSSINEIIQTSLSILFEIAGWFFIWTAFEYLFLDPHSKKPDLEFYGKMASAPISFHDA